MAKTETVKVRGDGKDLGEATYQICETTDDLLTVYNPEGLLALVNGAAKTKAANEYRRAKMDVGKVTDRKILSFMRDCSEEDRAALALAIGSGDSDTIKLMILGEDTEDAEADADAQEAETPV